MSNTYGMIKVPKKFPPLDPATATKEEIAEREKILAELKAKNHEIEVRNAYLDFATDARLRLEKGEKYVKEMCNIIGDIRDEINFLESHIDDGFSLPNAAKELSACFFGLAAQNELFHFALTDDTLFPHEAGSIYEANFAEVNEKVFQSHGVKCCIHHGESDALAVQFPPLLSRYENYQSARGGSPFPTSYLPQYTKELSTQLRKIMHGLPHYQRYHFAFLHVYNSPQPNVIDNDNRDVKRVIDTICAYLGTTDNPFIVSLSHRTILTKTLKKGSYVLVSNDTDQWPNLVAMTSIFEQHFLA